MAENMLNKYQSRIAREGILKSVLCGLIVGFSALAVCGLLSWFFGFREGIWVSIALFVVGTGVSAPLFYVRKFRPTSKAVARRVDALGLEERVLTMMELGNDNSFIALKQRADTMRALSTVNHMLVKIAVSAALIVPTTTVGLTGLGLFTVDTLYYAGVIDSGMDLLKAVRGQKEFTVFYGIDADVEEDQLASTGTIYFYSRDWNDWTDENIVPSELTVKEGESVAAVYAEAAPGWVFAGWSDGLSTPYRRDTNVTKNLIIYAYFEENPYAEDDPLANDTSHKDVVQDDSADPSEDPGLPSPPSSDPSSGNGDGNNNGAGAGGGVNNSYRDGQMNYPDEYDKFHQESNDRLNSNDGMSDSKKGTIGDYMDNIQKGGSGGDGGSGGSGSGGSGGGD